VLAVEEYVELSEEGHDRHQAGDLLGAVLDSSRPTVICSHRPVLPDLLDLLHVSEEPLSPAEVVVVHHRKGRVAATERHLPR
jgi:8-oxo-dGTP diphosphatase